MALSTTLSGFLSRAEMLVSAPDFSPPRSTLRLAALRNAPVEHNGFTLALFTNHLAVDSAGRLFILQPADYNGLIALATAVGALPPTGGFRNTWRVAQPRTSFPIDRILDVKGTLGEVPEERYEDEFRETSVYGFGNGSVRELKEPVQGITKLPDELWTLTSLVLEGRADDVPEGERNDLVLDRVRAMLSNAF